MDRIYLDNAATSFPKPDGVYAAVDDYNRRLGTAVGRSAYRHAVEVQSIVERCRKRAADFFRAPDPDHVIFTFNGTDSLNLALQGVLEPGDHVVTSVAEHNSVLRPLATLHARNGIEVTYVRVEKSGRVDPAVFRSAMTPKTKLVALLHASNVTGAIQPIADVGQLARDHGALFLTDAAQSAGHLLIDVREMPVDLVACPGHKGLLGPLGTGLLWIRPGVEERLQSIRQGGTGSNSEDSRQPETLPDKYESGNHNAPGLCGLEASLAWLQKQDLAALRKHEIELTGRLLDGLKGIDAVTVYGPESAEERVGVVSLNVRDYEPQVLAAVLDENFGIETRAGLHCAPGMHRAIGTLDTGGTVRFSLGPFTTADEIDAAVAAVREIAG